MLLTLNFILIYFILLDVTVYMTNTARLIRCRNCLPFASTWVHPWVFGGVRVGNVFNFLCCPIVCLYVLSPVLFCPARYPLKMSIRFKLDEISYLYIFIVLSTEAFFCTHTILMARINNYFNAIRYSYLTSW